MWRGATLCAAFAAVASLWAAAGAAAYTTNPDGSLVVSTNLEPLPPVLAGTPIYPTVNRGSRHYVAFGLNNNLLAENPPLVITPAQVAGIAKAAGASFVRLDMIWPNAEPTENNFQWTFTDDRYSALVAQDIRPMFVVNRTPNWAVGPDKSSCSGTAYGVPNLYCSREPDAAHLPGLTTFAAELARRYPLAAGFEYRNEPNLAPVASPTAPAGTCASPDPGGWYVDPTLYVTDLQAFSTGVWSTRADMRVWGGALSNCLDRDTTYAAAMLDAGAASWMTALSWHPYDYAPTNINDYEAQLSDMYSTIGAHGHPDLRLVAGEVGALLNGGNPCCFNQSEQSTHLQAQYTAIGQDSALADHRPYEAFVGFNDAADPAVGNGYGWLGPKNALNKWPARRVYCDWRTLLGVTTPLPSYVLNCLP